MRRSALALVFVLPLFGCGGDGGTTDDDSGDATTDSASTDSASAGDCASWLVTYDLTGSHFMIDATADFDIELAEPYSDDDKMGPGTMTIRFPDSSGAPGAGAIAIVDYKLTQNFVTGISGFASVTTDLQSDGADVCGITTGTVAATSATWSANAMDPVCQDGQISCAGSFCGTSGSPAEDSPLVINNECSPLTIASFEFAADFSTFTMPATVVSSDSNQTTSMSYQGTQTAAVLDSATPGCYCN
ncbi:MAG: hypothetical protein KC912_21060 [Proteobacteria bacterium]|nr:hypothetical protein [Pseudomonadota bacterium]